MRPTHTANKLDLDHVLHSYPKISEAPDLSDLYERGVSIDAEREKQYKAMDSYGNVYLIMNPAVWPEVKFGPYTVRQRPQPKLMLTSAAAIEEAKNGPKSTLVALPGTPAIEPDKQGDFGFLKTATGGA